MKVIVNSIVPFPGYIAMAFYNIIFWRKEYDYRIKDAKYYNTVINHESIHEAQMRDFCKYILIGGTIFYIIYIFEWVFRLLFTKDAFSHKAYRNISFEQEAYNYEQNYKYLVDRVRFAQWKK